MAKRVRTHLSDSQTDPDLRPKHLTKQEFGKRLYKLMISKGWHQSELARRADVARATACPPTSAASPCPSPAIWSV